MDARPNILLITADQFRWDTLRCAGHPAIQTPHLDTLAARGTRFCNAFSPDPICVPARATIMTGNYPTVCTGVKANSGRIRADQPLLTDTLKRVGYRAYAVGKLHFVPYAPPGEPRLVHGFDAVDLTESGRILARYDPQGRLRGLEDYGDFLADAGWGGYTRAHGIGNNDVRPCASPLPPALHVDHWIADRALHRLERHAAESPERPFFLWMSSPKPHSPYDPPRPYDALYDPRRLPRPFGSAADLVDRDPFLEQTRIQHAVDSLSPEAWQVIRSYYYGSITFLDAMIGRVLDHLQRRGLADRTLVLFTADHGDLLGDFGSCFKSVHLNGSVRIPFLAAGPGVAAGRVSQALVGLQDLLPTLAAAAGTAPDRPVHGRDLGGVLADPGKSVRPFYYATTRNGLSQSAMVCDGAWKYIYTEANGVEELYDQADLAERRNAATDPNQRERRETMRRQLADAARTFGDEGLLEGDGFKKFMVDRTAFLKLPVAGMGWRWY